ncbi:MAG TPA: flagellar basal-body MS-ring/collar protein FliF [Sedimentisphaerales bacterium]|nr:flagellar basal-body MS-ring/collar protein FliF [Sedimentisphaerales bacterium]
MSFLLKILSVWQNLNIVHKAVLISLALAFAFAGTILTHWATKPEMRMLFQGLESEEAAKITEKIAEKGIEYELRNGGTTIYAPKQHIYQLRLDMAKDGLPTESQGGYKLFDNEKVGISPFVQNVNLKRALQDELAKSIQMIEGINFARVHIVSNEQKLFASQDSKTSASVILKLKSGYKLNSTNIAAITHMVSSSVEGLISENVSIVDSDGQLLSSNDKMEQNGAGGVQDFRERVELRLSEKVEDMLNTVLGPGRATVKVNAIIDMNSVNLVKEMYDPTKKVAAKEEITSNSENQGDKAAQGDSIVRGGVKKDETISTEYLVPKITEQKTELPGQIKSLSVAAVVDLSVNDPNAATSGETAKIMQKEDVQKIIENALGINLKRGDTLSVVEAKFNKISEIEAEEEKPSVMAGYMQMAEKFSLGIMGVCALLALKMFSGSKKKKGEAVTDIKSMGQITGSESKANLAVIASNSFEANPAILRKQIASALQNNPDQVKQLFASWINEKG